MKPLALLVFVAPLSAACVATTRTAEQPFHSARLVDVEYTGSIGPEAGGLPANEAHAVSAERDVSFDAARLAEAKRAPRASIQARFARVDRAFASRVGTDGVAHGRVLADDDLALFDRDLKSEIAAGRCVLLSAPTLQCSEAQEGSLRTSNELAFVQGFEMRSTGPVSFVDPRVHAVEHGVSMRATPRLATSPDAVDLDVSVETLQLMWPVESATRTLPGTDERVEIQIPIALRQTVAAHATLARDEALVLGPHADADDDRAVVVVIRAQRVTP